MGDSEGKIEYTPDELAEIEKVLGGLPLDELPRGKPVGAALAVEEPAEAGAGGEEGLGETDEFAGLEEEGAVSARPEDLEEVVDVTDLIEELPEEGAPARRGAVDDLDSLVSPGDLEEVPEIDTGEPAVVPEESLETIEPVEEIPEFEPVEARPARPGGPSRRS